jgi:hypothetical protein
MASNSLDAEYREKEIGSRISSSELAAGTPDEMNQDGLDGELG